MRDTDPEVAMAPNPAEMSRDELEREAGRRRIPAPRRRSTADLRRLVRMKNMLDGPKKRRY